MIVKLSRYELAWVQEVITGDNIHLNKELKEKILKKLNKAKHKGEKHAIA